MINTIIKDGKIIANINDLKNWEKNPRSIKEKDYERLKKQIGKLNVYKPLLITNEGTVLGGNMRLRAYKELGIRDIWVSVVDATTEKKKLEYALSDNDRAGFYDSDLLANMIPQYPDFDWSQYAVDIKFPENIQQLIDNIAPIEEFKREQVKDIKDIKILNLYSCIGGNRRLWGELDITAVELNPEIAKIYQYYFPNDKIIITDAHKYLEEHFEKYDFIWSSPPCPTHSRMRKNFGNSKPIYPDMKLYEEILFLQGYFKGKWCIENVISWYDSLIKPQERGRHYYWANFDIPDNEVFNEIEIDSIDRFDNKMIKKWGFDLTNFKVSSDYPKDKIIRDIIHPEVGKYILEHAYNKEKEEEWQTITPIIDKINKKE